MLHRHLFITRLQPGRTRSEVPIFVVQAV